MVFSAGAANRRRVDEFVEEICILLLEGPQDKKSSIDLYITQYADEFEFADELRTRLEGYLKFIVEALPNFQSLQLRRPVNLYALLGALDRVTDEGADVQELSADRVGAVLQEFDSELRSDDPSPTAARYQRAASRQTETWVRARHGWKSSSGFCNREPDIPCVRLLQAGSIATAKVTPCMRPQQNLRGRKSAMALAGSQIAVHSVTCRAKDPASVRHKIESQSVWGVPVRK